MLVFFSAFVYSRLRPRSQSTTPVQPLSRSARTQQETTISSDSFSRTEHQIHNSRLMRSSEDHLISVSRRSKLCCSLIRSTHSVGALCAKITSVGGVRQTRAFRGRSLPLLSTMRVITSVQLGQDLLGRVLRSSWRYFS